MPWTRICGVAEIGEHDAKSFSVTGTQVLVLRLGDQYLAIPPVCVYAPRFLSGAGFDACFDGNAPKCNQHLEGGAGPEDEQSGISEAPILRYATKVADGQLYIDLQTKQLSDYERITCSPIVESGQVQGLRFSLWSKNEDEHKDVVYGRPA